MDKRTKEIRNLLTGWLAVEAETGRLMAARSLRELEGAELFSGADMVRIFGVHVTKRQYAVQGKTESVWQQCKRLFVTQAPVLLRTSPDTLAMLHRPIWGKPSLITLDADEKDFLLCIYTARTILARFRAKRLLKKLEKLLPAALKETAVTMTLKTEEPTEQAEQREEPVTESAE